ncbi:hypothetical protein CLV84_2141 [Neolewinella xylanilytica]|uniref:Secreted protein (Por secretion system target) n=1 Tax=Neolewinella xylanilytica TaxID=1514080 RepID=A0A2S6I2E5_9BACT|nr:hypothetical protein [Neolewinella xylanilytica]PPK85249.1 hypothetical protein CLV84_2141 [Neolewinella xylanilytica]
MKSLLFALALATTVPATATTVEPLITRSFVEDNRLELVLANLEQERTVVRLTNLDQDIEYFSDRVKHHNGYGVSLSLDKLPAGRYVLSVEKGDTVRRQVILKTETGTRCSAWK